jgi:ribonuclease Z
MSFTRFAFLGTSSAVPRPGHRNVSGMFLQFSSGSSTIIDCGEGTQQQLMRSSARLGTVDNILLTHLHGDHCYGIFGLMHTLNMNGRVDPLNVYGPRGVDELLKTVFRLTGGWDGFPINITELEPGKTHSFDLTGASSTRPLAHIRACPMVHRIPAFGYVIREPDQPLILDAAKAKSLGVEGPDLGKLKSGENVILNDGTVVLSSEVTRPGREARTIGIMQDTSDAASAFPYMSDCDLLIHEATFEHSLKNKAVEYGHSTSTMAAEAALRCRAKNLVLTHFSSRYGEAGENHILKTEAETFLAQNDCNTKVVLAEDFLSISGDDFGTLSSILPPEK